MILRWLSFFLHLLAFILVSLIFLPILLIANHGTDVYLKWWEKITSF